MKKIILKEILDICNAKLLYGNENLELKNFSKDTRDIKENDIYLAIKGENFDGNLFIDDAFKKGAIACITDNKKYNELHDGKTLIYVKNTVEFLASLAEYKRVLYNIPVIAITGSVGKTSTKDMIASTLKQKYKVLKTEGNYNNEIGLPLSILKLKNEEVMVLEMGMNSFGEISLLSKIAKPDIAIITNIGTAHIGKLGGRKNILKAKLEILEGLKENGTLIINNDNDMLNKCYKTISKNYKIITTGINHYSDYNANDIENDSFTINSSNKIKMTIPNNAFIYNSLIAYATGKLLNVDEEKIIKGIENCKIDGSRLNEIKLKNNITLIDDCYNASYESIVESISYLKNVRDNNKIIVLGDVLELGKYSKKIHKEIGKILLKTDIDDIILIGNDIKYAKVKNAKYFKTNKEGIKYIKNIMKENTDILIKASNGMNFKTIVEELQK